MRLLWNKSRAFRFGNLGLRGWHSAGRLSRRAPIDASECSPESSSESTPPKKWDRAAFDIARPFLTREQLDVPHGLYDARGAILCTALVDHEDPLEAIHASAALIECETVQRWGLFLSCLQLCERPITVRGAQGIFYVPRALLASPK